MRAEAEDAEGEIGAEGAALAEGAVAIGAPAEDAALIVEGAGRVAPDADADGGEGRPGADGCLDALDHAAGGAVAELGGVVLAPAPDLAAQHGAVVEMVAGDPGGALEGGEREWLGSLDVPAPHLGLA